MSTKTKAYGSFTIVDITDIGEFSIAPESNKPTSVICDPNYTPAQYTPSWTAESPLTLTAKAYYAGKELKNENSDSKLYSVTWSKQDGVGTPEPLPVSENGTYIDADGTTQTYTEYVDSNDTLIVRGNVLATSSGIITYKCEAEYIEPISLTKLKAAGQITFSLIQNATKIKTCNIKCEKGENAFLYKSDNTLVNPKITLNVNMTSGLTVSEWKYYSHTIDESTKQVKGWTTLKGTNNVEIVTSSLWIDASTNKVGYGTSTATQQVYNDLFKDDRVQLKVITSDTSVYDEITLIKLRDGANGDSIISVHLSNEDQVIPFHTNESGVLVGNYSLAYTTVQVYEGNKDVTSEWTINEPTGEQLRNVTGSWDSTNKKYTVDSLTDETGDVNFICTKTVDGKRTEVSKKFTLSRVMSGVDGVSPTIYSVETGVSAVRRGFTYNTEGVKTGTTYSPSEVTFSAYKQTEGTTNPYEGYMTIKTDTGEVIKSDDNAITGNGKNATTRTIEFADLVSAGVLTDQTKYIVCKLYSPNTETNEHTTITIQIISDGSKGVKGDEGAAGDAPFNVIIGNPSDQISCYANGITRNATLIEIPFTAYQGVNKTKCQMKITNGLDGTYFYLVNGQSDTIIADNGSGTICFYAKGSSNLGSDSVDEGQITLQATCYGKNSLNQDKTQTSTHYFKWTKNRQGEGGKNAAYILIDTPYGNIMNEDETSVQLVAKLLDGASAVPNQTYTWKKHVIDNEGNVTYETIDISSAEPTTIADGDGKTEATTPAPKEYEISADTSTLTVYRDAVNGYASYKCETTYGGNTVAAYQSVEDKNDPLQVFVHSTLGNQIKNGYGIGAIYVKVMKNGVEVDALKSEYFVRKGQTLPDALTSNLVNGKSYYYEIDTDNSVVNLKKYVNNEWCNAGMDDAPKYIYQYSFRDMNGDLMTNHGFQTSGKVIYVDGSLIDQKVTIEVAVTHA